ncbi:clathrin interactor EPSIN 1 [Dorcoceras hygrometricum]|uniref:Clathrin interactor EPSIN 1 n=1 Tax=Dorcoceras hygrometricum TaxID=472368 RepID=A0A2Z7CCD6_9LAMI|nr:clathrin interactor EPSIN 1 [Dorcoceras hygrometricum]
MDFMKVFDQTVREIKREVNLKVLKVPEIEQKVLDATEDEPWGPHGTALAEIAQATKKFTECQMVMNVLWARVTETGKNWRLVYKALAVIEYLVAHGSERAVDDIVEHTFQISSLASFEYVEPSGKDMGINVRKKAEAIVALLNNKDKIQEVRNKAAENRDKYIGLSSSGMTYKSSMLSVSGGSFSNSDKYGGFGNSSDGDRIKDSYRNNDQYDEGKYEKPTKSKKESSSNSSSCKAVRDVSLGISFVFFLFAFVIRGVLPLNIENIFSKGQGSTASGPSKTTKASVPDKSASITSKSSSAQTDKYDDDDFDPRGTSSSIPSGVSNQVDLFGQNFVGDLLDAPISVSTDKFTSENDPSEVDLFADAAFVSATPKPQVEKVPVPQTGVDLFASQPAPAVSSPMDFFASAELAPQLDNNASKSDAISDTFDPFSAIPLNNFDGFASISSLNSHTYPSSTASNQNSSSEGSHGNPNGSSLETKSPPKKGAFQVKSGIWADSLSRGLIDLNITAPKKVNLADVGIVGGLSDGSEEKEKGLLPSFYQGRAMGIGPGLGRSSHTSTKSTNDDDFFSSLNSQQYEFGSFQK